MKKTTLILLCAVWLFGLAVGVGSGIGMEREARRQAFLRERAEKNKAEISATAEHIEASTKLTREMTERNIRALRKLIRERKAAKEGKLL